MRKWIEVTAKTVDDAITEALIKLGSTRDKVDIEVIEKESSGFLGLNKKPARIRASVQETLQDKVVYFLEDVFKLMEIQSEIVIDYNEEEKTMNINIIGEDMVHEFLTLGTGDKHLTHVRDVKDTARLTHGIVLIDDVCILDWHIKPAERAYKRTQRHVFVVKTGSLVFHKSVSN